MMKASTASVVILLSVLLCDQGSCLSDGSVYLRLYDDSYDTFPEDEFHLIPDEPDYFAPNTDDNVIIVDRPEPEDSNDIIPSTSDGSEEKQPDFGTRDSSDSLSIEQLSEKIDNLMSKVKAQEDKITELESVNKKLEDKLDLVEQQTKTNNLLFHNVRESNHESSKATLQKVLNVINRIMKVRVSASDISMALRVNCNNATAHRPIVVKLVNFATKMKIMGSKSHLDLTNIMVTGDYSEKVAEIRKQLLPYLHAAKKDGVTAFLLYDKLVVDGVKKTLEELQAEEQRNRSEAADTEKSDQNPDDQVEELMEE